MGQPHQTELDELVARGLDLLEESGPDALEALCAEHPERAADLRRRIALLRSSGMLEADAPDAPTARQLGPYRLIEPLGGGGMGLVHTAFDEQLGREVALKTIRPELLGVPAARRRFEREMTVVAKLSHPGIVPVYDSGEDGGQPWFAMERVRGATLGELLDALDGRAPEKLSGRDLRAALVRCAGAEPDADLPLFGGSWSEVVATLGRATAEALDHAHRAGVLHRDVKPSNVLIGLDGRPRLIDFGLALPETADGLTRSGALVGSLPYMAPEQVQAEGTDRRTDVYGLGATLIELATLEPPFTERGSAALTRAILEGAAPDPRGRNPALPRDLATVLGKAVERDPRRRYIAAAELARDLSRVLACEPIEARPTGPIRRIGLWVRRHPVLAVGLGALVASSIAIQVGLARANRDVRRALEQTEDQRDRAASAIATARAALIDVLAELADDDLALVPGFAPRREAALRRAELLWDELSDLGLETDDGGAVQAALLQRERASVLSVLGRGGEATDLRARATATLERALEADPTNVDTALHLADAWLDATPQLSASGRAAEAIAVSERAAELVAPWTQPGTAPEFRVRALAILRVARHNAALYAVALNDADLAETSRAAAVDAAEQWVALAPEDSEARLALAKAYELPASIARSSAVAIAALERAQEILVPLVADDPAPEYRFQLGVSRGMLASRSLASDPGRAQAISASSIDVLGPLVDEHPYSTRYRRRLAQSQECAGIAALWLGRPEEAAAWLEQSAAELGRLAALAPGDRVVAETHAIALHNLANIQIEVDRPERAEALAREVLALLPALAGDPPTADDRRFATFVRLTLEQARAAQGAPLDPVAVRALVEDGCPDQPLAWSTLAATLATGVGGDGPRADAALAALERAIELGYDRVTTMDNERAFEALRERPEWPGLRARVAAQ